MRWSSKALVIGTLLALSGLAGMSRMMRSNAQAHAGLPRYGQVPSFAFIDQAGEPISQETLRGRIWIADFIFTRCAGQCPMLTNQMAQLAALLKAHPGVRLVSFTVDPDWDTPEVLSRYATAYHASRDQWLFVTGEKEALHRFCREGFRLALADEAGTAEEPISHSVRMVLIDRTGTIRGYYDAADEAARAQLRKDLQQLLASPSS